MIETIIIPYKLPIIKVVDSEKCSKEYEIILMKINDIDITISMNNGGIFINNLMYFGYLK